MRRRIPARMSFLLDSAFAWLSARTEIRYRRAMALNVSPRLTRWIFPWARRELGVPTDPVARMASADGAATAGMITTVPLGGRDVFSFGLAARTSATGR